ncbi:hypothetical protein [Streptomyces umbrinus]|uniref:hypothetical protein n=1 Tax=Streptomyces umbrinus TaxID=67370 RepID=UPI0033D13EAA
MAIMADAPVAATRPPLPRRPVPHEKTPDRPTPSSPRPHPRPAAALPGDSAAHRLLDGLYREHAPTVTGVAARALRPGDRGLAVTRLAHRIGAAA